MCLLYNKKFANNKKSNVERHFLNKPLSLVQKYSEGVTRKKVALKLMRNPDRSKHQFNKWIESANLTTYASFVVTQEIAMHGQPFTDEKYIKNSLRYLNI